MRGTAKPLTHLQRWGNYIRQNGHLSDLTPRQRRRLDEKAVRHWQHTPTTPKENS